MCISFIRVRIIEPSFKPEEWSGHELKVSCVSFPLVFWNRWLMFCVDSCGLSNSSSGGWNYFSCAQLAFAACFRKLGKIRMATIKTCLSSTLFLEKHSPKMMISIGLIIESTFEPILKENIMSNRIATLIVVMIPWKLNQCIYLQHTCRTIRKTYKNSTTTQLKLVSNNNKIYNIYLSIWCKGGLVGNCKHFAEMYVCIGDTLMTSINCLFM